MEDMGAILGGKLLPPLRETKTSTNRKDWTDRERGHGRDPTEA